MKMLLDSNVLEIISIIYSFKASGKDQSNVPVFIVVFPYFSIT